MAEAETGQSAPTNKDLFQFLYGLVNDFASNWRKVERLIEKCSSRKWVMVFNGACLDKNIFNKKYLDTYVCTDLILTLPVTVASAERYFSKLKYIKNFLRNSMAREHLKGLSTSAYRQYHSTETAVLKVFSDVLEAADQGKLTLLVLLDLSAAFDTVDHDILCRRLQSSFGFDGPALNWLRSYLNGRECQIKIGDTTSSRILSICGVPQGSVLGPTLFSIYTADLSRIIASYGLRSHFYADNTQVYGHCDVNNVAELSTLVSACVDDVYQWMKSSRLQLNSNKSEVIWFTTHRRSHQCPSASVRLGNDWIPPSSSVRDLGVFLDSDLTMQAHVGHITRVCFKMLRQIRVVAAHLPSFATKALVTSLVLSKLDYCNSVMVGLPKTLTRRLQSVVNAAARLVMRKHKYDRITPILSELHWLGIERRIEFKVALLVFKCLKEMAPPYLASKVTRLSDLPSRKRLRSSSSSLLFVPTGRLRCAGTGRLRLLAQGSGTNFHLRSHPQQPLKALQSLSRRIYTVALRSCDSDLRHHKDCLILSGAQRPARHDPSCGPRRSMRKPKN